MKMIGKQRIGECIRDGTNIFLVLSQEEKIVLELPKYKFISHPMREYMKTSSRFKRHIIIFHVRKLQETRTKKRGK